MTFKDPREAFDKAIEEGRLALEPYAENHAGKYMYMGTDENGRDLFKNIVTRRYDA